MNSLIAIGAGIAALTGIGAGIGIGLLGCALAEGTAIFGMVVAILIILFLG